MLRSELRDPLTVRLNPTTASSELLSGALGSYDIEVHAQGGTTVYSATHPAPVAEAIIRALLSGRSTFSVSTDGKVMDAAVRDQWSMGDGSNSSQSGRTTALTSARKVNAI